MSNKNTVIFTGHIHHEPEFRTSQAGNEYCLLELKVPQYDYKQRAEVPVTVEVMAIGEAADLCRGLKAQQRVMAHCELRAGLQETKDKKRSFPKLSLMLQSIAICVTPATTNRPARQQPASNDEAPW